MASRLPRALPPWAVWGLLGVAFVGGYLIHTQLDLEISVKGLRAWVDAQGNIAPFLFVLVLTFRQFLLLPSILLCSVGGICFGLFWGTILGALGLFLSGVVTFGLGRGLGGEGLREKFRRRYPELERKVERFGPWIVFAAMAYPGGPMTGVFWASGLTTVPFAGFVLAVAVGSLIRAFTYSFFGASLADGLTPRFFIALGGLAVLFLAPLAFPSIRRWLKDAFR